MSDVEASPFRLTINRRIKLPAIQGSQLTPGSSMLRRDRKPRASGLAIVSTPIALWIATVLLHSEIQLPLWDLLLLASLSSTSMVLAIAHMMTRRLPAVLFGGPLIILVVGGLVQILIILQSLSNSTTFIADFMPELAWVTASDATTAYIYLSLGVTAYCVFSVLADLAFPTEAPRTSDPYHVRVELLARLTVAGIVGYLLLSAVQFRLGIGQGALHSRTELPFRLSSALLFVLDDVAPALILLLLWLADQRSRWLLILGYAGLGVVVLTESYIATSRGAIINAGLPVFFLWLICRRFNRRRTAMVILAFLTYLVVAPIISDVRVSRVAEATTSSYAPSSGPISYSELRAGAVEQTGHFIARVQGAGSMLWALEASGELSPRSLYEVLRPAGVTERFTYDIVGVQRSDVVSQGRAPTALGLGMLAGGLAGMVLLTSVLVSLAVVGRRFILNRLRAWPVAMAIAASALTSFFSEGVPMIIYKAALVIGLTEVVYRRLSALAHPPAREPISRVQ